MNPRVFLAIDPSIASTGVAIMIEGEKEISTALIQPSDELKEKKGFEAIYTLSKWVTSRIGSVVSGLAHHPIEVCSEFPPPVAQWSAGLYALDSLVLSRLHRAKLSPYLIPPTRIDVLLTGPIPENAPKNLQRKIRFTKSERREFLYEILKLNKITVSAAPKVPKKPPAPTKSGRPRKVRTNTKLSNDETDAALLLVYLVHGLTKTITLPEGLVPEKWELKETPCRG